MDIVLASASPRRAALLRQLGLSFTTVVPDVDERINDDEAPKDYVQRVANDKAQAVGNRYEKEVVIAGDTVAVYAGKVLGKANSQDEAHTMLKAIRGQTHQVFTALSMRHNGRSFHHLSQTTVTMADYNDALLTAYLESGDWVGKAGACSLQDRGALLIDSIAGDLLASVGLSYSGLTQGFSSFGLQRDFLTQVAQPIQLEEEDHV